MSEDDWVMEFDKVHASGVAAWRAGRRSPLTMFSQSERDFLATIGCTAQELFDFIDDLQDCGEPDFETTIAVQSIRRDYFLNEMAGQASGRVVPMADLPEKSAAIDGISWLPRLIVKARLKLRGEMPPELMYGCGGDRPFLRRMNMTLPGFLKLVWECADDERKIVQSVKLSAGAARF